MTKRELIRAGCWYGLYMDHIAESQSIGDYDTVEEMERGDVLYMQLCPWRDAIWDTLGMPEWETITYLMECERKLRAGNS